MRTLHISKCKPNSGLRSLYYSSMRRVVIQLGAVAALFIVIGFVVSPDGFAGNLIAEAVGILVAVAVALTLAEDLARKRRREDWARVRRQTLRSLCGYIEDLSFDFWMSLPDEPIDIRTNAHWVDYPSSEEVDKACAGLRDLEERVVAEIPVLAAQPDLRASSSRLLFEEVKQDLFAIRDVLAPRVMSLDEDPQLSQLLGDLEEATRRWSLVLPAIEEWGVRDEDGWKEAISVFRCARAVYEKAARRLLKIEA